MESVVAHCRFKLFQHPVYVGLAFGLRKVSAEYFWQCVSFDSNPCVVFFDLSCKSNIVAEENKSKITKGNIYLGYIIFKYSV